jgi:hypothetical protein
VGVENTVEFPFPSAGPESLPVVMPEDEFRTECVLLDIRRSLLSSRAASRSLTDDESVAFGIDRKFPGSDHAPVVVTFEIG